MGDTDIFEIELKASLRTRQIEDIKQILENTYKCSSEIYVYHDAYFDTNSNDLTKSESELRLRRIITNGIETVWLTCKEPPFDKISKSKVEHEVEVSHYENAVTILKQLGYIEDICFQKNCTNFRTVYHSLEILVTLATVQELKQDFIEVEIKTAEAGGIPRIYEVLTEFLFSLQVMSAQLTSEYYTDMVRQARRL